MRLSTSRKTPVLRINMIHHNSEMLAAMGPRGSRLDGGEDWSRKAVTVENNIFTSFRKNGK
ncbi:MAG: hypothetical protein OHK0046_18600 [Anaerolineae bacterium]